MHKGKILSVICARAGSKGLKNKCLQKIGQKMVVEYAIDYSLMLGDRIKTVVSTDIKELLRYCASRKIDHIDRDPKICLDNSRLEDALADAIDKKGAGCSYCSLVYGNIPTRYPEMFNEALEILDGSKDYDAVISMQNVEKFNPEWMLDYSEGRVPLKKVAAFQRQALHQRMIHDGHTVLFRVGQFYRRHKGLEPYQSDCIYAIFGENLKSLVSNKVIVDIDTARDLELAELIFAGRAALQPERGPR